jgi:hypothetical protein
MRDEALFCDVPESSTVVQPGDVEVWIEEFAYRGTTFATFVDDALFVSREYAPDGGNGYVPHAEISIVDPQRPALEARWILPEDLRVTRVVPGPAGVVAVASRFMGRGPISGLYELRDDGSTPLFAALEDPDGDGYVSLLSDHPTYVVGDQLLVRAYDYGCDGASPQAIVVSSDGWSRIPFFADAFAPTDGGLFGLVYLYGPHPCEDNHCPVPRTGSRFVHMPWGETASNTIGETCIDSGLGVSSARPSILGKRGDALVVLQEDAVALLDLDGSYRTIARASEEIERAILTDSGVTVMLRGTEGSSVATIDFEEGTVRVLATIDGWGLELQAARDGEAFVSEASGQLDGYDTHRLLRVGAPADTGG